MGHPEAGEAHSTLVAWFLGHLHHSPWPWPLHHGLLLHSNVLANAPPGWLVIPQLTLVLYYFHSWLWWLLELFSLSCNNLWQSITLLIFFTVWPIGATKNLAIIHNFPERCLGCTSLRALCLNGHIGVFPLILEYLQYGDLAWNGIGFAGCYSAFVSF